jgi:hypothetical protein
MKHEMNQSTRYLIIFITLLVVAIVAAILASSFSLFPRFPFPYESHEPPLYPINEDLEFFYTAKAVLSTVNMALSIILLATYVSLYRKTRSEFTLGLTIFSAVFLLNASASNPLIARVFGFRAFGLGPFAMLPDLFSLAALAVLLFLSIKY